MKLAQKDQKIMNDLKRYPTKEAALKEAIRLTKENEPEIVAVAKDPEKEEYVIVRSNARETIFARAGYKEIYNDQYIVDIVDGRAGVDNIEEV